MPPHDPNARAGVPRSSANVAPRGPDGRFPSLNLTNEELDEIMARAARRYRDLPRRDPGLFAPRAEPVKAPPKARPERKAVNWREED